VCDVVILATGGLSYPKTGSTGDGYLLAQSFGHTITSLRPALIPLYIKESDFNILANLNLKNVKITINNSLNQEIYQDFGEITFLEKGVGGPLILSASTILELKDYPCVLNLDLKPALTYQQLENRLDKEINHNPQASFLSFLTPLLPQKMIKTFAFYTKIDQKKKAKDLSLLEKKMVIQSLKNFSFTLTGPFPIEEGIITAGGVSVAEVNPQTMESLKVKNLYFAGEILDTHGFTGGYNLQIAFSTGYLSGISC